MSVLALCKFTPLGFETIHSELRKDLEKSVNLPRWGLKQNYLEYYELILRCKFTPLGFETLR